MESLHALLADPQTFLLRNYEIISRTSAELANTLLTCSVLLIAWLNLRSTSISDRIRGNDDEGLYKLESIQDEEIRAEREQSLMDQNQELKIRYDGSVKAFEHAIFGLMFFVGMRVLAAIPVYNLPLVVVLGFWGLYHLFLTLRLPLYEIRQARTTLYRNDDSFLYVLRRMKGKPKLP